MLLLLCFYIFTQININNQELWEEMLCLKGLIGKGLVNIINGFCCV